MKSFLTQKTHTFVRICLRVNGIGRSDPTAPINQKANANFPSYPILDCLNQWFRRTVLTAKVPTEWTGAPKELKWINGSCSCTFQMLDLWTNIEQCPAVSTELHLQSVWAQIGPLVEARKKCIAVELLRKWQWKRSVSWFAQCLHAVDNEITSGRPFESKAVIIIRTFHPSDPDERLVATCCTWLLGKLSKIQNHLMSDF